MVVPRPRRRRSAAVAAVVAAVLSTGGTWAAFPAAGAQSAGNGPAAPALDRLPEDRARGLTYAGLRSPRADGVGPCRGRFEMVLSSGEVACSHGPDAAPEGVDVREPAPVPTVSAEAMTALATAATCQGDGVSGKRVQLVYARAAGVADRYASMLPSFQQWAAQVDDMFNASAQETGGTRRVRYVHDSSCVPTVLNITLSATGDDNLTNTIEELRAQGHNRADRKYLVWVDANVYCGIAQVYTDDRPGAENYNNGPSGIAGMVARVDTGCWGHTNLVEAHELSHTLGSVQPGAPNATEYGHCTDDYDRMCYPDAQGVTMVTKCAATGSENRFDCNKDDYFSTAPPAGSWLATHWNTANSEFLAAGGSPPPPPPSTTTTSTTTSTTTTVPPRKVARADYDGNGTTDIAVFRKTAGQWFIHGGNPGLVAWGQNGDLPVTADYTGDGKADVAVFRASTGQWFISGGNPALVMWGVNGDIPVPADYDGDGKADIAVFRPSTGQWFIRNAAPGIVAWGQDGDVPVPADYNGDGKAEIAVYRPLAGTWFVRGGAVTWYGAIGDVPVPADYNGDGKAEIAVFRPAIGAWYVLGDSNVSLWGILGDVPVPGDYDGNGIVDKAIFRPLTGEWWVEGRAAKWWGGPDDLPTAMTTAVLDLLF